jgi:hypothetical protein
MAQTVDYSEPLPISLVETSTATKMLEKRRQIKDVQEALEAQKRQVCVLELLDYSNDECTMYV